MPQPHKVCCQLCNTKMMETNQFATHMNSVKHKKKAHEMCLPAECYMRPSNHNTIEINHAGENVSNAILTPFGDGYDDDDDGGVYDNGYPMVETPSNFQLNQNDFPEPIASQGLGRGRGRARNIKNSNGLSNPPSVGENNGAMFNAPISVIKKDDVRIITNEFQRIAIDAGNSKPKHYQANEKRVLAAMQIANEVRHKTKDCLQALMEISSNMLWRKEFISVVPNFGEHYRFKLRINDVDYEDGGGLRKKDAERNAVEASFNAIYEMILLEMPQSELMTEKTFGDIYAEFCLKKLKMLANGAQQPQPAQFAAFVITTSEKQKAQQGMVVALGTGTHIASMPVDSLKKKDGQILLDMRCLTIARRSLVSFIYNQLYHLYRDDVNDDHKIRMFFELDQEGKARLKKYHRLHLFLSDALDGDFTCHLSDEQLSRHKYTETEIQRDVSGKLHFYVGTNKNGSEGKGSFSYVYVNALDDRLETYSTKRIAQRLHKNEEPGSLRINSQSDKLFRWIHVGFQGALLTHFVYPIFVYSINFGRSYVHEDVARCLFQRLPTSFFYEVSVEYRVSNGEPTCLMKRFPTHDDPFLSFTTSDPQFGRCKPRISLNWHFRLNEKESRAEVVDTQDGKVFGSERGHVSTLCKNHQFQKFNLLLEASLKNHQTSYMTKYHRYLHKRLSEGYTYGEMKKLARPYETAKHALMGHSEDFGKMLNWAEMDEFQIEL